MLKKQILFILLNYFLFNLVCAQQLIEEVKPSNKIYELSFQKYKLDNNLIVILHKDTTVSNVYVQILYKVGSNNEKEGQRGFAHFFEHLMFTGTKHLSKEALRNLYPKTPSTYMNAHTTNEYTTYENQIPANYLETALWLESERLQYTPDYMNEWNFNLQKKIILNELAMRSENDPDGVIENIKNELLYHRGHPLHYPVIGYKEDIEQSKLEEVRDFYKQWYVPNNAILTISGNIDIQKTLLLVNKYFGSISTSKIPENEKTNIDVKLAETIHKSIVYDIEIPRFTVTFPTVKRFDKDEPALDALSYILNQNDNPKRIADAYKTNLYDATIWRRIDHLCNSTNGEFMLEFGTEKTFSSKNIQSIIQTTFESYYKKGYSEENLNEYRIYFKNRIYDRISTIKGIAHELTNYEFYIGSPNGLPLEWENNLSLTKELITSAFTKYLYQRNNVEIDCFPIEKIDNKNKSKTDYIEYSKFEEDFLWNNDSTINNTDYTDYSKIPNVDSNYVLPKIKCWQSTLQNGIKIYGTKSSATPKSVIELNIKGGLVYNPIEYAGLSYLYTYTLNSMLHYNNVYNSLKQIGSEIDFYPTTENIIIQLKFPNESFNKSIALLDSILFYMEAPYNYLNLLEYHERWVKEEFKSPYIKTNAMLKKAFYVPSNILSYTTIGSKNTLSKWNGADFDKANKKLLETNVTILYAGNLSGDTVIKAINTLAYYKTDTSKKVKIAPSIQPDKTNILFHNKKNTTQSFINIGIKTITNKQSNKYTILQLVNFILSSRLSDKMREQEGLSYYCNSSITNNEFEDILDIKTQVNIEKTDTAIIILINELNKFIQFGITQKEVEIAKKAYLNSTKELPESLDGKIDLLYQISKDKDWSVNMSKQQQLVKIVSTEAINQFIRIYLKPNTYQIAVESDKTKILTQLQKLSYQIIDYTDKLY